MVLRLMKNPSDEQRTLRSPRSPRRPRSRPKLMGAVKRIVATTKEYVEAWRLEEEVASVFVFSEMVGMYGELWGCEVFFIAVGCLQPSFEDMMNGHLNIYYIFKLH